jgi:glycosyltransferase involved in cell wall biosynthesis
MNNINNNLNVCFFGSYDKTYTSNKLILQGLRENNIPVVEINAHIKVTALTTREGMTWGQIIKRILRKYKIFSEIVKKFGEFRKTNVIYVGYPGHVDVYPAYIAAKLFGKKLVFNPLLIVYVGFSEEQGILNKKSLLGKVIKETEKVGYNLCDMVFADTPMQKEFLKNEMRVAEDKISVLPIGADNKGYEYSEYNNTKSKKINVVYYGLYAPIHGVEYLIEAARKLRDDQDIEFTMVGSGNKYEETLSMAKKYNLQNVNFYPNVFEGEHLKYLQNADIFVGFLKKHSSVDKVIPNKVYQGLALGRAVLTADSPATRSVFEHKKNIYLIEPSNSEALVGAILDLKNNFKLRTQIAMGGYELYLNKFTPKKVGARLIKHMEKIL